MLLYCASSTFYFVNGCIWWIPYIKIWWYVLSRGGISFCEIIRDPNPHGHARPKYSHDCSRNVWIKNICIIKKWVIRTQISNRIARKILEFGSHTFGYYPHFLRAIFGAYSFSLFGFSVIHFLLRIVGYKLRFVQSPTYRKYCPRRPSSGKSYLRGIRHKKNRHRKKRRIKKKRAKRSPFVKSFSSAFTTVLNVDE